MDRQRLTAELALLPIEELVAILRDVFADRVPFPEETAFWRSRFYLGFAHADLLSEPGIAEQYGPWQIEAVAYPNPAVWGDSSGLDHGLCEAGRCNGCGYAVRSNVKDAVCPVCGSEVRVR